MKRKLALILGITGDMAFAAGCLLLSLRRHSPCLGASVILYHDGNVPLADARLLEEMGANLRPYFAPSFSFDKQAVNQFSLLALARLEGFLLLREYKTVIWLDVDTAIQGDISGLCEYGPLSMAVEDPYFGGGTSPLAGVNVKEPVDGLDGSEPNLNSGVLVLNDSLPDPEGLYRFCFQWMEKNAAQLKYMDQPVLNMLAQKFQRENPRLFTPLPFNRFNTHPRNPAAWRSALVHAYGAYKLWDDGLTRCVFPEWQRDYARWCDMGGTPWQGPVDNREYLETGAFALLRRIYDSTNAAQELLEKQQAELDKERSLRMGLEKALERLMKK